MYTLPVIAVNGVIGAQVSPLDRGFSYGDGVFETCRVKNAKIPLWILHGERLLKSCEKLFIPISLPLIEYQLEHLFASLSTSHTENAVVKITVTRGQGGRGYSIPDTINPTIVIGVFPPANYPQEYFSQGITAKICTQRLGCNPGLAGLKHLNRLEQVLARAEWQDNSIAEGIMFDANGNLIEAVFSNIFLVNNKMLFTPDLSEAGVAGVMRRFIIETIAPQIGLNTSVIPLNIDDLLNANEVFLCNSLYGIWPVRQLMNNKIHIFNKGDITAKLQEQLNKTLYSS